MEEKNKFPFVLELIGLILVVGCIIWNIYDIAVMFPIETTFDVTVILRAALFVIGLGAALVYFMAGYKKDAAKYFKFFVYIYAIGLLETALFSVHKVLVIRLLILLKYGLVCLMATGVNLGKKKSHILCAINLVLNLADIVYCCIKETFTSRTLAIGLLAALLWIMIGAKYSDKAARGTN